MRSELSLEESRERVWSSDWVNLLMSMGAIDPARGAVLAAETVTIDYGGELRLGILGLHSNIYVYKYRGKDRSRFLFFNI